MGQGLKITSGKKKFGINGVNKYGISAVISTVLIYRVTSCALTHILSEGTRETILVCIIFKWEFSSLKVSKCHQRQPQVFKFNFYLFDDH